MKILLYAVVILGLSAIAGAIVSRHCYDIGFSDGVETEKANIVNIDNQKEIDNTVAKVNSIAGILESKKDSWYSFIKYKNLDQSLTDEVDDWGTPFAVLYTKSIENNIEVVFVTSAGPDKKFGTADDIFAERQTKFVAPEY